mmetsp:Transcript_15209/g.52840  ORF Transcript_15209/g.52840 Transcript_15209/m.52840 type:complete len:210 (-) Transcript_15209:172-801(-)
MLGIKKKAAETAGTGAAGGAGGGGAAPAGRGRGKSLLGVGGKKVGARKKGQAPAEKRLFQELPELRDLDCGDVAKLSWPDTETLTSMQVKVTPDEGYWARATFVFTIKVTSEYPHAAPKVMCTTPIYHPNIDKDGNVCLNILKADWKPVLDVTAVIHGILHLFEEPNPDDPLNHEAAETMRDNEPQFRRNVENSLGGGYVDGRRFPRLR